MEQLTKSEKIHLGIKEITKRIREQLKQFKNCEFSITHKSYSGGSSITIALMKANFKVFRDFEDLSESAIFSYTNDRFRTIDSLKELCLQRYAQIGEYSAQSEYNPNVWNNGHFLTLEVHNLLKEVCLIVNQYNYDNSDIQTDYFDVNFYLHLHLGKWDKPLFECV